jgi:hypothetical protein
VGHGMTGNFKQLIKSTGLIIAGITIFVALVAGIWSLVSYVHKNNPVTIYNYATTLESIQATIEGTDVLTNIELVASTLSSGSSENVSELGNIIRAGLSAARSYREYYWGIDPSPGPIELYRSLMDEGTLLYSCYSNLYNAWSAWQSQDSTSSEQYCSKAMELYGELKTLRAENKQSIDNLKAKRN